jgi:hypothetical protein
LLLLAVALLSVSRQIPVGMLTRDPTALADMDPLTGLLSNLGILLWSATAAIAIFGATVLQATRRTQMSRFLFWSGALTLALTVDDLFQFHEDLAERYFGLQDGAVYLILGIAMAGYLALFGRTILHNGYAPMFGIALALFALSLAIDTILDRWLWRLGTWEVFAEDGAKFLGIASWCGYFAHTAYRCLAEHVPIGAASNTKGVQSATEIGDRGVERHADHVSDIAVDAKDPDRQYHAQ